MTPMIASTIVTIASLPVYWFLYRTAGPIGLAIASDIGISAQALIFALILHRRRVVSLAGLGYGEMGKALVAGVIALMVLAGLYRFVHTSSRIWELAVVTLASLVWFGVCLAVLRLTGSSLPDQMRERFLKNA
jgi:putative peptidoglycan lipid II flippase